MQDLFFTFFLPKNLVTIWKRVDFWMEMDYLSFLCFFALLFSIWSINQPAIQCSESFQTASADSTPASDSIVTEEDKENPVIISRSGSMSFVYNDSSLPRNHIIIATATFLFFFFASCSAVTVIVRCDDTRTFSLTNNIVITWNKTTKLADLQLKQTYLFLSFLVRHRAGLLESYAAFRKRRPSNKEVP